ncbi:DUF2637 domain-containing protein [Streptomyces montanus]|uniref:DUF2637 domain-containing protein n=1 Tax=Streptomyces montanus TaxID=2580423 RepID=A0A5R9FTE0_9ACTN|nr:DUF2637 domain-containing protein [Streptomyces montanus]TLS44598.1 DUF2637 domain-containing protein [Streptomyces montanus]
MSGYWPRPDEALDSAGYQPSAFGADVLDPTVPDGLHTEWAFDRDLAQLLQTGAVGTSSPPAPVAPSIPRIPRKRGARRRPNRLVRCARWIHRPAVKVLSLFIAALSAVIVSMLSVLGALIAYDPLRRMASPGSPGLAAWWPLLVYGPWLMASLSILRAALHRRRATHSWAVVVLFSAIAMCLCVANATRSPVPMAVAGLPPLTALLSFHQFVRQITLTIPVPAPAHALPRPRHAGRCAND